MRGQPTRIEIERPSQGGSTEPLQSPADLRKASLRRLVDALRRRQISSRELVTACIERIDAVNPSLNALVQRRDAEALAEADAADRAISAGDSVGPLCGVPMTLKDSIDTKDLITTWGTPGRARHVPERDASVVRRLRRAGAILLGKTNTPELTLSFHTDNPVYGPTRNPYALDRSPGGSSGGAAALIAAGATPFDVGSDTGGSIRQPAHCCGIAGLRPTSGRVPRTGHAIGSDGPLESLTQLGPMARNIGDLEFLLEIVAGPDGSDPAIAPVALRSSGEVELSSLRVALYVDDGIQAADADTARCVRACALELERAGVKVAEARPPGLDETMALFSALLGFDGGAWVRRLLERSGTEPNRTSLSFFRTLPPLLPDAQVRLFERWGEYRRRMFGFLRDYDALLCPVHASPAQPLEPEPGLGGFAYTMLANLTGWPAAVCRVGNSELGLPIGVQLIARHWCEDVCLALAAHLEAELGGWQPPGV